MDLHYLTVILLGIVEGLTEFLPVSSTGHLILASELLGYDAATWAMFNVVIQLGAILAVVVLYWRRFWDVAVGLFARKPGAFAFVRNIVLGFLPAMVIGLVVYKAVKALLESPTVVAVALIVGGIALAFTTCQAKAAFIELFTDQTELREPSLLHHQSPHRGATILNPLP